MKVFGQEQLLGAAPVDQLLAYALSLPVSLASVGMPKMEHIEHNARVVHGFRPLSKSQREHLMKSIEQGRKLAMVRFLEDHQDV